MIIHIDVYLFVTPKGDTSNENLFYFLRTFKFLFLVLFSFHFIILQHIFLY